MPKLLYVVTLARLGRWFGLAFVFAFGAALALVLHVNSGAERRLVAELVPRLLADNLKGSFSLEGIEEITSSSVVFREFTAKDPRGREVVRVARVRVRRGPRPGRGGRCR